MFDGIGVAFTLTASERRNCVILQDTSMDDRSERPRQLESSGTFTRSV